MLIIITKNNATFIRQKMNAKALNVVDSTEHTITVKLSEPRFMKLRKAVVDAGLNPYAIMAW
jgi:hypothetical protein